VKLHSKTMTVVFLASLAGLSCKGGGEEEWMRRVSEANDKVVSCKNESNALKAQISELKQKLAVAMTSPARITLTDPDILNLIADIKSKRGPGDDVVLGKGDLNPKEASRVVRQGAQALQMCYERALKKNSALQFQAGVSVTLEITVKPSGQVKAMNLAPHVDNDMLECVRMAVTRWKFPPFGGEAVVVTQRLTLTPKT
jgi:hypothetical protein